MGIFVPMGIPDFNGGSTKGHIALKYTISGQQADKVDLEVRRGGNTFFKVVVTDPALLRIGTHEYLWDGFDDNGILDTAFYIDNDFNFLSRIYVKGEAKFAKVKFKCSYKQVDWADVRIDRNNKRVDVTLRVNLKDGGENGTENDCKELGKAKNAPIIKKCPWDRIPKSRLISGKLPITERTQSFEDLRQLALTGIDYHWGRNKNHSEAKNGTINGEPYEVFLNTINTEENAMDDVNLVFNTNGKWMRSGNPGTVDDPISFIGNIVSREAICYNVGYIKYSNDWFYQKDSDEIIDFKYTSAHEIGHTILKAYGGTFYSYGHKDSVNTITQSMKSSAPSYSSKGEIDIMPYYPTNPPLSLYDRYAAAEKDVMGLIWLAQIETETI
ncbi:hypothetical protein [Zobellia galactanivorans]|uniref:hypothetical protein n=1 Tax=Zobellia galactanivorans (strain DSM 12802 / CCUG 47099 / CIP 106680 / NCIMB 13871 / Dsij) TaxID=63186 RepID=UPI001C07E52B|nr:hypothetical protein [Zobellia galactanivorans]MBU3024778.1 hypothetical protein [Zobellia galactanivorans]